MTRPNNSGKMPGSNSPAAATVAALLFTVVLTLAATQPAQAQSFKVIYNFNNNSSYPDFLSIDSIGNLYGTLVDEGSCAGMVYKLVQQGSAWSLTPIHMFCSNGRDNGFIDGSVPSSPVILAPDGSLLGTTFYGGGLASDGTVFRLSPEGSGDWSEQLLYSFNDSYGDSIANLALPAGDIVMDQQGDIFGSTYDGYNPRCTGCGGVYELSPADSAWTEQVLYGLTGPNGGQAVGGLVADAQGNLFGTASAYGEGGWGTAFEVSPSNGGWSGRVLHAFSGVRDGATPAGALIFGSSGRNLFGTTTQGGTGAGGTVFELSPQADGSWSEQVIYGFGLSFGGGGCGPATKLAMDRSGNLYGTTLCDGANAQGTVFRLSRVGTIWSCTSLHDFSGGYDGGFPSSNLVLDANGNLYGTTSYGGSSKECELRGCGVIYEIPSQAGGPACSGYSGH